MTKYILPTYGQVDRIEKRIGGAEPVFGVMWDKVANPALTRLYDSAGMVANAGVDLQVVRNDFDTAPIFGEMARWMDAYGNVFVYVPKCYIKKVDGPGGKAWLVSKKGMPGAYLPWCFWDFDKKEELPGVLVGAHKASLGEGDKLESKPGKAPLVNTTIVNMRTYAKNNNTGGQTGYQQMDVHVNDLLQTLFIIEFATLHGQSIMKGYSEGHYGAETHLATETEENTNRIVVSNAAAGGYRLRQTVSIGTARYETNIAYGRIITAIEDYDGSNKAIYFDGDPVTVTTGNFLQNTGAVTGFSSQILASSGSIGSNTDGKYPMVYRGIESFYGDTYEWIDGINIKDWQTWVAANPDDYASNAFAHPYKAIGYKNAQTNEYIKSIGFDTLYPFVNVPTVIGGGADKDNYYCDYYIQGGGERVAWFGGNWNDGSYDGPFCLYLHYSSAAANVYASGRLLKKPLKGGLEG